MPVLGDVPFVGRLFRSESITKTKKNLMLVFITPIIINPDGTRYHSDEELPFNQASVNKERRNRWPHRDEGRRPAN